MWDFLANLPPIYSFIIIVLLLAVILIIALRGKIKAKVGDKEIDVGNQDKDGNESKPPQPATPDTPDTVKKRSCGDCVLIMLGNREKYEMKMRHETDRILKTQMTFAEQKLIDIQTILINAYSDGLFSVRLTSSNNADMEAVQHKLFYGLLRDSLLLVKDELRRSFKDNGFFDLVGSDFTFFVKDRVKTLVSIIEQHIRNLYPDRGVLLNVQEVIRLIEAKAGQIESTAFEMYTYAKDAKLEADAKTKEIKTQFAQWIDNFIK